jgi:Trk-type K+ transport systems, membrane components
LPLHLSDTTYERVARLLNLTVLFCGLLTLGLLVLVLGVPLSDDTREAVAASTRGILTVFVIQEALRFALAPRRLALLRSRRIEALLAVAIGLELTFSRSILAWLQGLGTEFAPATLGLFYLAGTQLTLLAFVGLRAIRGNSWLSGRSLSPGMVFILSFALLIAIGTLLLKLPNATRAGISWVDAIFLATSASCITGLTPLDISSGLTLHGQWILLGLVQLGGLGVMTLTYFFAYFVSGGISLRNRIGLQDLLSEENLGHVGAVLTIIVAFTLGVELLGAGLIYFSLHGRPDAPEHLAFFSLFHAVSAFCNAGFSTLPDGLADPRIASQRGLLSVVMILIVLGGLGFPVVKNFRDHLVGRVLHRFGRRVAMPPRLTTNSRLVLVTTALLLVGGAIAFWVTEFATQRDVADAGTGSRWFTALFYSVTARTAGFNVTPVDALLPASGALLMFLMFVGGSPASTAGGIKTSTLALAILSLRRVLLGRRDIEAFGRRLPRELIDRALSILFVAIGFTTVVTISLCMLHPELPPDALAFEAVSAIGTAGLTRGITPQLGDPAKLVVACAMLVGRVGVLTFLASFMRRRPASALIYPETNIILS